MIRIKRTNIFACSAVSLSMTITTSALGQSANLLRPQAYLSPPGTPINRPATLDQVSLIMLPAPPQYQLHDLIHIQVNETIVNRVNAQLNKRRNNQFKYSVDDFILLLDNLRLRADNTIRDEKPGVNVTALNTEQKQFQFNRNDILRYAVQAEVVEIRPNGNLVLEANGEVSVNNEIYIYKLAGIASPLDIDPRKRVIDSNHVASKRLDLNVKGAARDGLKRGFITAFIDWFQPL
ncbi:flagellar basal body L-ring protein FlgH [bacterium]|nr:flagellar basal body L-ring protein FlgH [bacterium]